MTADVQRELAAKRLWRALENVGVLDESNDPERDRAYLNAEIDKTLQALIADAEKRAAARAEEALRLIDRNGCENLTRGRCSDDPSRTRDSDYTSTQWCPPCIAAAALDPSGAAEGAGR